MALVQKSFSDIITFSRSSNATRVGPTGVVEYAPHNLQIRSEEFDNAAWFKNNISVTANSTAAPNGTVTADSLIENTANGFHSTYSNSSIGSVTGTYTFSFYAKPAGRSWVWAGLGTSSRVYFDLANGVLGTVSSGLTATITNVGNGWYRCSVTQTVSATSVVGEVIMVTGNNTGTYIGDGTSGILLWGAQLSVGPYALDYTPTTSAAVYGPRFDYDGSGVTIVEPVSTNLVLYSQEFENAYWTKGNASITANASVAPDGTTTADKLVENSSNAFHYVGKVSLSVSAQAYTTSFYAKAAERTRCFIDFNDGVTGATAYFDLSNGTSSNVSALLTVSISSVGNGWYRITASRVYASATGGAQFTISPAIVAGTAVYTGDGTSGIFIWGAQLEVGSTATAYMVSGATNGFRAVPVVSGSATPKGLLVEEQRTNTCTYSEDITAVAWKVDSATRTSNAATSPDGTVNADSVTYTASTGKLIRENAYQISVSGSTTYTISVWLRVTSGTFKLKLSRTNGATWATATLSPELTVTTTWQRFTLTYTSDAGDTLTDIVLGSEDKTPYTLPATGTVLVWGFQHEAGSFATSYIPTLASTVTRSADVASVNTLSPWFNASAGTLYAESVSYNNLPYAFSITNTGSADIIGLGSSGANFSRLYIETGGVTQANVSVAYTGSTAKEAAAYAANDAIDCVNGTLSSQDTSVSLPTLNKVDIGYFPPAGTRHNGWIRRLAYFPRRLSSAELQALTA